MVLLQGPPQWTVLATCAPTLAALVVSRITTGRFRFWTSAVDWTRLVCGSAAGAALVVTAYIVLPGIFTADPRKLNWSKWDIYFTQVGPIYCGRRRQS